MSTCNVSESTIIVNRMLPLINQKLQILLPWKVSLKSHVYEVFKLKIFKPLPKCKNKFLNFSIDCFLKYGLDINNYSTSFWSKYLNLF